MSAKTAPTASLERLALGLALLTAASAPAYVIRWHVAGILPTTALESLVLVTLAAFALLVLREHRAIEWRSPLTVPATLFLLAGLISVVDAPSRIAALGLFRAYLLEPILFAVVLVTLMRTPARAHALVVALYGGGVVLAVANSAVVLHAIVTHTFRASEAPPVAIYTVGNAVALYLVPLVGLAGAIALHERGGWPRLAAGIFLVIGAAASVITFSRGGWLALAGVAIGLALSHRQRLLLLIGAAASGVALALVPLVGQRASIDLRYESGHTFSGRLGLWSDSVRMLLHRPLTGAGLAGFVDRVGPTVVHRFQSPPIYPHNLVLNFWSETGLLGLVSFAWIFALTAAMSWRGWRSGSPGWRPIHLGVLLALVAVLIHGLVDVPYFKNDLSLQFWSLVALAWAGRLWQAQAGAEAPAAAAEPAAAVPDVDIGRASPSRP